MNPQLREVEVALHSVEETLTHADFDECDQSDVQEAIERVERELEANLPNVQLIGTFLNSIARSLRTEPTAAQACLRIDEALRKVGVAPTWSNA